jgi:hypothetical protein
VITVVVVAEFGVNSSVLMRMLVIDGAQRQLRVGLDAVLLLSKGHGSVRIQRQTLEDSQN